MAIAAMGNIDNGVTTLMCDSASDVANLADYAERTHLKPGSTAIVADTSETYIMKTTNTWVAL